MTLPFSLVVAGRYLRARKAEGFVSVIAGFSFLGIMLGVATLIIVMSVMNGFETELLKRLLGLNGHINIVSTDNQGVRDYELWRGDLMEINGINSATPIIQKQGLLNSKGSSAGVVVRGYNAQDIGDNPLFVKDLRGSLSDFKGNNIWIGTAMATNMGLRLGDEVVLLSPEGRSTPFGSVPKSLRVMIAGVFDVGMYEYNSGFVLMPLKTAQAFYDLNGRVSQISLQTNDALSSYKLSDDIAKITLGQGVRSQDWKEQNQSYFNALAVERNVMFLILTLIIIVAAFNVISGMIMMVKDKSRDIAILRTMGASRSMILRVFVMVGGAIGVLGTFTGALLGTVFALNIENIRQFLQNLSGTELFSAEVYFLSKLPAEVESGEVLLITVMSLVLSLLATIYPAWRAASIDPVEALRYG